MMNPSEKSGLVSYAIRDIVVEAKQVEKTGKKMFWLNIGDPAPYGFRPPKHVLNAIKLALKEPKLSGYAPSAGDPELVDAIAKEEGVSSGDVFVTSGLSEGIDFFYYAMMNAGDSVLLPSPTYPLYITKQKVNGGVDAFYDCLEKNWEPDLDSMRKAITPRTKAISIINPNNPTGAVYSRKTLSAIVDLAGEFKLPIFSDDAYEFVVFGGDYVNLREIRKDVPLVSGGSISKNFMYPGARVGWLAFHGEGWDKVKEAMMRLCNQRLSINWEMQRGALAAITGPKTHLKRFNSAVKKRSKFFCKRVKEIDGLSVVQPKGAFYAFVKIEDLKGYSNDWDFVRALLKEGVVTVPGTAFSHQLKHGYLRAVLLPPEETLGGAADVIEKFMKKP